jgi:serine/threonine protein kinase
VPENEILGVLGQGGMGVVSKARQVRTDQVVALKVPHAGTDLAVRVRFLTEGRAAARLQHPGIVQMFEVSEVDRVPYMALEFCPGGSLAEQLDGTPLPPRAAAGLVETVARAVAVANAAGVVHRNLKPGNVLFGKDDSERVKDGKKTEPGAAGPDSSFFRDPSALARKVGDFGLAHQLDEDRGQTRTGTVVGTRSYMAPEQARRDSRRIGPGADVYAVGVVVVVMGRFQQNTERNSKPCSGTSSPGADDGPVPADEGSQRALVPVPGPEWHQSRRLGLYLLLGSARPDAAARRAHEGTAEGRADGVQAALDTHPDGRGVAAEP